jgi:hypothetical protein
MTIPFTLLFAFLFALTASVSVPASGSLDSQYVPVAKRYPGLFIGSPTAAVNMELVYDPTCNYSVRQATEAPSSTT